MFVAEIRLLRKRYHARGVAVHPHCKPLESRGRGPLNPQMMANIFSVEPEQVYSAKSGGFEGRAQVEDTRTSGTRLAA